VLDCVCVPSGQGIRRYCRNHGNALGPKMTGWVRTAGEWVRRSKSIKAVRSIAELLGKLTIFVGILTFIVEAPERAKQRHYQAWQLINGARRSPGEAGRSIAIGVLVSDHIEMAELDLTDGSFRGKNFQSARMPGVNFSGAELDGANFSCKAGLFVSEYWFPTYHRCWVTHLEEANFNIKRINSIKFDHANLTTAVFGGKSNLPTDRLTEISGSTFEKACMEGASIRTATLVNNSFTNANMRRSNWVSITLGSHNSFAGTDLSEARWQDVQFGTLNAGEEPSNFTDANLSSINISNQGASTSDHVLNTKEDKALLVNAILCRTKFSEGMSYRDCSRFRVGWPQVEQAKCGEGE
jgi:uncharacterized protein YjbI with pentapeptide repeats